MFVFHPTKFIYAKKYTCQDINTQTWLEFKKENLQALVLWPKQKQTDDSDNTRQLS